MDCQRLASFYNDNFPTDKKTYIIRVPVISLIISIISWQIIMLMFLPFATDLYLINIAYVLTAAAVSLELYWGLSIGDRKQFTPWVIFKFCEVTTTIITIFYLFIEKPPSIQERGSHSYKEGVYVVAFIVLFVNILQYSHILRKYLKINEKTFSKKSRNDNCEENIYENHDDIYGNHDVK